MNRKALMTAIGAAGFAAAATFAAPEAMAWKPFKTQEIGKTYGYKNEGGSSGRSSGGGGAPQSCISQFGKKCCSASYGRSGQGQMSNSARMEELRACAGK
jgi:hypothetical protein